MSGRGAGHFLVAAGASAGLLAGAAWLAWPGLAAAAAAFAGDGAAQSRGAEAAARASLADAARAAGLAVIESRADALILEGSNDAALDFLAELAARSQTARLKSLLLAPAEGGEATGRLRLTVAAASPPARERRP